jgi:hypothetical protein
MTGTTKLVPCVEPVGALYPTGYIVFRLAEMKWVSGFEDEFGTYYECIIDEITEETLWFVEEQEHEENYFFPDPGGNQVFQGQWIGWTKAYSTFEDFTIQSTTSL